MQIIRDQNLVLVRDNYSQIFCFSVLFFFLYVCFNLFRFHEINAVYD